MPKSNLELKFEELWLTLYPSIDLINEFKPVPKRRFRADYAHIPSKVLIEINGGTWGKGGHSSGGGIERDYTKNNLFFVISRWGRRSINHTKLYETNNNNRRNHNNAERFK